MSENDLLKIYGAEYFESNQVRHVCAQDHDLYFYDVYIGPQKIKISRGDSAFTFNEKSMEAQLVRGPCDLQSTSISTIVRGYAPDNRSVQLTSSTNLPYVNGCSTKQIFSPVRPGDPTFQLLYIPPHSLEQVHHIHPTVRVVYVLSGTGTSVVGTKTASARTTLKPGMVCILQKMCPHHFETTDSPLCVLPVHVWSTVAGEEFNHPMFNGTIEA